MAINNSSLQLSANTTSLVNLSKSASLRGMENFTFMSWFKVGPNSTKAPSQSAYVERQGTGTGIRFRFTPVAGKLQFGLCVVDGGIDTSYTYNTRWDDRWHHAAFVARIKGENPTYQIYLDGVKVAEGTLVRGGDSVEMVSDTAPLAITIGNHSRGSVVASTAWEGSIDEVIVLKESVAQNEVLEYIQSKDDWKLKENLEDPEDEPLKYYWRFDEYSGTTTADARSSARTATLPSTTVWTKDRPFLGNGLEDTTKPTAPGSPVTSQITHDSFRATWAASVDNILVQYYQVQVSEYSNFSSYTNHNVGKATTFVVRGLLPTVNYYWRVQAYDEAGNASTFSIVQSFTTPTTGDNTPPAPPKNLAVSYLYHDQFTLRFTPSDSDDVRGYKLDISTSPTFDSYVTGYRNLDIGNIAQKVITGLTGLTSYYIRLRAYDMFDNESYESAVLRVNTLRAPDITPPQIVSLNEVSGISARNAILEWEEGVDDTGVAGYYIDISKNSVFSSYVSTQSDVWQHRDVGNVTSFRVTGLDEETEYFWRVRAYDEAGNISDNTEEPGSFRTAPASIYESGYITTQQLPTVIRSGASPATIGEDQPTEFFVGTNSNMYIQFDASTIVGTIQNVAFNFFSKLKTGNTTGSLRIRVYPGEITSGATGQAVSYSVLEANQLQNVDLSSLFTGGATTYTLEISSTGYQGYIDTGSVVEGYPATPSGMPTLTIESDPNTSTQPLSQAHAIISQERLNVQPNPSFEVNTNGWRGLNSAVIAAVSGGTSGSQSCRVVGTLLGSGVDNFQNAPTAPLVTPGTTYTVSFEAARKSGIAKFQMRIDALDNTGANPQPMGFRTIYLTPSFTRYTITGTVQQGKSRLKFSLISEIAGAYEIVLDNVLIEPTVSTGAIFNGTTFDALWKGAANNSVSTTQGAYFDVESPFLGDSNQNNTARAFIRNLEDSDGWFESQEPVIIDRTLSQYTTRFGPSYGGYNLVKNPSFELDALYWTGGTRVDEEQHAGDFSYKVAADTLATYNERISLSPGRDYTIQGMVKSDGGLVTVRAIVETIADNGTITTSRTVASTPEYASSEVWRKFTLAFKPVSGETALRLSFSSTMEMWLDAVQVTQGERVPPYRDGSIMDGVWEGNPHKSTSGLQLNGNNTYVTMFEYRDEEGFFDAENLKVLENRAMFEIPAPPDNITTVKNLELTASNDKIFVVAPYEGDDNENNTARIEFKRRDLTRWNEVRPAYYRKEREVRATIPGLFHGTNYQIRVTFADPDGMFGLPLGVAESNITTDYNDEAVDTPISITFGGFTLMGRKDKKIGVLRHDAFGFPNRRVTIEELPRQDGAVQRQALWGAKEIRIEGYISGDSRADLENVRSALVRNLALPEQRLIIDSLSRQGRYYTATCESLRIEEDGEKNISHLEWSAVFQCADPFAYDITEKRIAAFTTPRKGALKILNRGDAIISPYMEFTTTSLHPITVDILNSVSGDSLRPKVTIVRGDRLVIDSERKSLLKNGIEVDYSGGFIRLTVGENLLEFNLTASAGTPTAQVSMRWRHRYL